jgi:hypothetical protein
MNASGFTISAPAARQFVHDLEADVVARPLVLRPWIAEASDELHAARPTLISMPARPTISMRTRPT